LSWLLPLPVAIPLVAAAVNTAGDHALPRRLGDAIAIAGAGAACAFSCLALLASERHDVVHWFGGWKPNGGVAIGISFVADPLGAGMAVLASGLTFLTLIYSWTSLRHAARSYDVLMLVFCGAMCGFSLTGDIFNMFVWFELMGVAAYALAGFQIKELGPLQGAINFAVTNTVGAYLMLTGIALLYARTGALNLAQIGHTLAGKKVDGLEIVALTLVAVGFLVKAAIVPFHLWLADAHAAAPASVCVLFSGAMVELGLLAIARCYWTIFDAPFGSHHVQIRAVFLALGIATALIGAVMTFLQRHLKRLLAYSTITHAGIMLVGIALLDTKSLAGVADLVLAHGLLKGGLFLCAGILLVELKGVDELRLHGRARSYRLLGVVFLLGAVGLLDLPYVGTYLGHAQIEEGAALDHLHWVPPLLTVASGISTGAILRAGARIFLGWGSKDDPLLSPEPREEPPERTASVPLMLSVTTTMIVLGLLVSVVPGLGQRAEAAAARFRDRSGYAQLVLHGKPMQQSARPPIALEPTATSSVLYGIGAGAIAVITAGWGLYRRRTPALLAAPLGALKAVHSGIIGDYVMWLTVGTALVGGIWAVTLR
jgi:multicomponent Na+:H+ antiporter subunit D